MEYAFDLNIPQTLEELCDPKRMALLVYDMQVGIVKQLPDGDAVTERVAHVLAAARDGGFRVFFTRHMSLPFELAGVTQLRTAMAWQHVNRVKDAKPWFLRDSPGFALAPTMTPLSSEGIFDKLAMSAFVGTPLDMAMRDCGLMAFAIVGIALEIGIEPTVRHATDLGYVPVVVTDACGSRDKVAATRALDTIAFAGGSHQTDLKTICALFRRHANPRTSTQ